ncbi:MAG: protein translocase subunit SecD [Minisyncoccia bacterium]
MIKKRFIAIVLIVLAGLIGFFVYSTEVSGSKKFKLGLDLNGGTELVYKADLSKINQAEISSSMNTLRDVIEKRVNMFGVSEATVRLERVGLTGSENEERLVVELPGVTDTDKAIEMIGKTPVLEFKLLSKNATTTGELSATDFEDTGLTGRFLQHSEIVFDQNTGAAMVSMQFNNEGSTLFSKITKENVSRVLAIFLDGDIKSMPTIKEEINGGKAVISGNFNGSAGLKEAKALVSNLNLGALPVPIVLISTQTIGASLGADAMNKALFAGIWALIIISIFLIIWYRLPGFLACIALLAYIAINLAIFKLIPVTMTSAGIAGFILSIGMAVDANILIFERMKEELKRGREVEDAVKEGFARAWTSIRDSNTSSIITAIILFMFSSTSVVKGFALVFLIGVITSAFTAITLSRSLLLAIKHDNAGKFLKFLLGGSLSSSHSVFVGSAKQSNNKLN